MLFMDEFFGMALTAIWIYGIIDAITTDGSLVRNLPKGTWVFIVLFGFAVGAGAWIFFGRPAKAGYLPGDTSYRKPIRRSMAPDDNPDFLRTIKSTPTEAPPTGASNAASGRDLKSWEADLNRREQEWEAELARREDDLKRRQGDDS